MKRSNRYLKSASQEEYDQMNDPGVYYVYEKGQLRSPPGYGKSARYYMSSGAEETHSTLSIVPCFYESHNGLNTTYNPRKLLDICFEFVAKHIEYVDSLEGFPELIGHELLKIVIKHGRLKELSTQSLKILNVFCEAYGNLLLDTLILKTCGLQLESFTEAVGMCFCHLTVLDLFGCRIGDTHEMLDLVGTFSSLRKLGLCHNALSDSAIQKMTAPLRMFKRGPVHLQSLDLSCNPQITENAARYMLAFRHLSALDLSGTSVKGPTLTCEIIQINRLLWECMVKKQVEGVKKIEGSSLLRLVPHSNNESSAKSSVLLRGHTTSGWVSEVVDGWLSQQGKDGKQSANSSQTKEFYSRKKIRQGLVGEFRKQTEKHEKTPPRKPVLVFKAKSSECLDQSEKDKQCGYSSHLKHGGILNESVLNTNSPSIFSSSNRKKLDNTISPRSRPTHRPKPKLNLACAIDMLTEDTNDSLDMSDTEEMRSTLKRKLSNDSGNDFFNNKRQRHYSLEEQDLIGQYFAPSASSTTATSLIDAMLSPEWGE